MGQKTSIDSLGSRIVAATRMAVVKHLELASEPASNSNRQSMASAQLTAMIGGTDRRVTDDLNSQSVVSSPLSAVDHFNN